MSKTKNGWTPEKLMRVLMDPRATGITGYEPIIPVDRWVAANAQLIADQGAETWLRNFVPILAEIGAEEIADDSVLDGMVDIVSIHASTQKDWEHPTPPDLVFSHRIGCVPVEAFGYAIGAVIRQAAEDYAYESKSPEAEEAGEEPTTVEAVTATIMAGLDKGIAEQASQPRG